MVIATVSGGREGRGEQAVRGVEAEAGCRRARGSVGRVMPRLGQACGEGVAPSQEGVVLVKRGQAVREPSLVVILD